MTTIDKTSSIKSLPKNLVQLFVFLIENIKVSSVHRKRIFGYIRCKDTLLYFTDFYHPAPTSTGGSRA